jgi:nicotinamidase-related amidase
MQSSKPSLCDVQQSLLVVIDIQPKLGAAMPTKVMNRVIQNTGLLLQSAAKLAVPVIASTQYPQGLGPLDPAVLAHLPENTRHIEKTCFSCASAEGFYDALRSQQRSQVILVGMEAHVCVLQTAFDLQTQGYEVFVVEDAVCSRKLENYQNALIRIHQVGMSIISTESVMFEWLRDARHEQFKDIVALLH